MSTVLPTLPATHVHAPSSASAPPPASPAAFSRALNRANQATEVATRRTPISGTQAASALRTAWTKLHGEPPSEPTLAILVAQWAHETGSGQSMYNYNFGGIKGTGPSGLTTNCRTREGFGENERTIRDNFRAYRTAEEGAEDYLRLLERRFGPALQQARQGNPEQFVGALKRGGYFTGSEAAYTKSVASLTHSIRTNGFGAVGSPAPLERLAPEPVTAASLRDTSRTDLSSLDPVTAVSVLTLGLPDTIARSASRILGS